MLTALALAALLRVDPSGDAHGAGNLVPPSAEVFSSSAPFDLTEVAVLEGDVLRVRVRTSERPNQGDLRNGITLPVIDVYLDTQEGGASELLSGPDLRMPEGSGWDVAIRVTGDRAFARRADDASTVEHPVSVVARGDALTIATPFAAPERADIHALTGVYDPFGSGVWRPLAREASPWSFSSASAAYPVVDLLAEDDAAQRAALTSGVLPAGRTRNPAAPWLVLMILGLLVAVAGLVLRSRIGRGADEGEATTDSGDTDEGSDAPATSAGRAPPDDAEPADAGEPIPHVRREREVGSLRHELGRRGERSSLGTRPAAPPVLETSDLFDVTITEGEAPDERAPADAPSAVEEPEDAAHADEAPEAETEAEAKPETESDAETQAEPEPAPAVGSAEEEPRVEDRATDGAAGDDEPSPEGDVEEDPDAKERFVGTDAERGA